MRLLLLTLLSTAVVVSQSPQTGRVATDYYGRVVMLESSAPLKGGSGGADQILTFRDGGASVDAAGLSNIFYSVVYPFTNDHGDLRAFSYYRSPFCSGIGGCGAPGYIGVVRHDRDGWEVRHDGRVGLSRDGRWAVFSERSFSRTTWMDLWTAEQVVAQGRAHNVASVADDGTVATASGTDLVVQSPGKEERVYPIGAEISEVLIDRTGTYVAVAGGRTIWRLDLGSGAAEVWVPWDNTRLVDIGPRGAALLYSQWGVMYAAGEPLQQPLRLPEDGQTIEGAAMSGDGRFVIASSLDGIALYALDGSGSQLIIPGATAFVTKPAALAPGLWVRETGRGLQAAEIRLNGSLIEPLRRSHGELIWAVPKEAATGPAVVVIGQPGSPFEANRQELPLQLAAPLFILQKDVGQGTEYYADGPFIRHAGSGEPVTFVNPARPGESVEALMTGINGQGALVEWQIVRMNTDNTVPVAFESERVHEENPNWSWVRLRLPEVVPGPGCWLNANFGVARHSAMIVTSTGQ